MSNEMKNEILAAIGKVDKKVDNMQEEIKEIKKQVAKIPEIEKQVAKIPEIEKQVAKIPEIEKQVAKIPQIEKQVANIPSMQGQITQRQKQIADLQTETRRISRSVAVIEHEHGDKLEALFDAFTAHAERMEKQNNRICFCEHKLENYENELYYLKDKVQGL